MSAVPQRSAKRSKPILGAAKGALEALGSLEPLGVADHVATSDQSRRRTRTNRTARTTRTGDHGGDNRPQQKKYCPPKLGGRAVCKRRAAEQQSLHPATYIILRYYSSSSQSSRANCSIIWSISRRSFFVGRPVPRSRNTKIVSRGMLSLSSSACGVIFSQ